MKKSFLLILAFLVFFSFSCSLFTPGRRMLRGSGQATSETRPVSDFNQVRFLLSGDATITQGDQASLTIEADENILPLITSEVQDGRLTIRLKNGYSIDTHSPIRYTITMKDITGIEIVGSSDVTTHGPIQSGDLALRIPGSGSITINDLTASSVTSDIAGSGTISLKGTISSQEVSMAGSGSVNSPDLQSETARVNLGGSGEITLWATSTLEVTILGSGNVEYYGSPQVTQKIAGSGKVVSRGEH